MKLKDLIIKLLDYDVEAEVDYLLFEEKIVDFKLTGEQESRQIPTTTLELNFPIINRYLKTFNAKKLDEIS